MQSKYTVLKIAMCSWWSCVKDDTNPTDWKCHRTHTCKVSYLVVFFRSWWSRFLGSRISCICCFSCIHLFSTEEKQNKLNNAIANDENIMQASIQNAHYMCRSICKSTYPFAHLYKNLHRGCFRWIGKNAKKLKRTMFQQSAANLSFFGSLPTGYIMKY